MQTELFPARVGYPEDEPDTAKNFKDAVAGLRTDDGRIEKALDLVMDLTREEVGGEYYRRKKLSAKHATIIALHTSGMSSKALAQRFKLEPSTISQIITDPRAKILKREILKGLLTDTATNVSDRISGYTEEALEKVVDLMRHAESERVQQTSAFDILDRGGFKPKEVIRQERASIDKEAADEIVRALQEASAPRPALEMVEDSAGVFQVKK